MSSVILGRPFLALYAEGLALADEIDDYVDAWHDNPRSDDGSIVPLHTFLGFTEEEYASWVHDPDVLPHIVRAHRLGRTFRMEPNNAEKETRLAARAPGSSENQGLEAWLARRSR